MPRIPLIILAAAILSIILANTAHVDGHVLALKAGTIGLQHPLRHPSAYWDRY